MLVTQDNNYQKEPLRTVNWITSVLTRQAYFHHPSNKTFKTTHYYNKTLQRRESTHVSIFSAEILVWWNSLRISKLLLSFCRVRDLVNLPTSASDNTNFLVHCYSRIRYRIMWTVILHVWHQNSYSTILNT